MQFIKLSAEVCLSGSYLVSHPPPTSFLYALHMCTNTLSCLIACLQVDLLLHANNKNILMAKLIVSGSRSALCSL